MELTDAEIETLAYTLLGEAEGEGAEGMIVVANVIRNRAESGLFKSDDPVEIATQKGQFTTNDPVKGNQTATRERNPPGSKLYETATKIVRETFVSGTMPDLTDGTLYYHADNVTPYWAPSVQTKHGTKTIGNHVLYPTKSPAPVNGALIAAELLSKGDIPDIIDLKDGGVLNGMAVSANPNRRKSGREQITGIVFHHTGGSGLIGALSAGQKGGIQSKTSAHYYIDRDGTIYRYADDGERVNHIRNPESDYRSDKGLPTNALSNANTIGVEVVAPNSDSFTQAQKEAAAKLSTWLSHEYGISTDMIVGHGSIQGGIGGNKLANEGVVLADFSVKSISGLIPPMNIPEVAGLLDVTAPAEGMPPLPRRRPDPESVMGVKTSAGQKIEQARQEQLIERQVLADARRGRLTTFQEHLGWSPAYNGAPEAGALDVTPVLDWEQLVMLDRRPRFDALFDREASAFVGPDQIDLRPLKPGERVRNADGSISTEFLSTVQLPDGSWASVPSIWQSKSGPFRFDPADEEGILGAVARYEATHGTSFRRFGTVEAAVRYAEDRSAAGGADAGPQIATPTTKVGLSGGARIDSIIASYTMGGAGNVSLKVGAGAKAETRVTLNVINKAAEPPASRAGLSTPPATPPRSPFSYLPDFDLPESLQPPGPTPEPRSASAAPMAGASASVSSRATVNDTIRANVKVVAPVIRPSASQVLTASEIRVSGKVSAPVLRPAAAQTVTYRAPSTPTAQRVTKSVEQIGREADNARLNGYRAIQEMGPSSGPKAPVLTPKSKPNVPTQEQLRAMRDVTGVATKSPIKAAATVSANVGASAKLATTLTVSKTRASGGATGSAGVKAELGKDVRVKAYQPGAIGAQAGAGAHVKVYTGSLVYTPPKKIVPIKIEPPKTPVIVAPQRGNAPVEVVVRGGRKVAVATGAPGVGRAGAKVATKSAPVDTSKMKFNTSTGSFEVVYTDQGEAYRAPNGHFYPGQYYTSTGQDMAYMPTSYQNNPRNYNGGY